MTTFTPTFSALPPGYNPHYAPAPVSTPTWSQGWTIPQSFNHPSFFPSNTRSSGSTPQVQIYPPSSTAHTSSALKSDTYTTTTPFRLHESNVDYFLSSFSPRSKWSSYLQRNFSPDRPDLSRGIQTVLNSAPQSSNGQSSGGYVVNLATDLVKDIQTREAMDKRLENLWKSRAHEVPSKGHGAPAHPAAKIEEAYLDRYLDTQSRNRDNFETWRKKDWGRIKLGDEDSERVSKSTERNTKTFERTMNRSSETRPETRPSSASSSPAGGGRPSTPPASSRRHQSVPPLTSTTPTAAKGVRTDDETSQTPPRFSAHISSKDRVPTAITTIDFSNFSDFLSSFDSKYPHSSFLRRNYGKRDTSMVKSFARVLKGGTVEVEVPTDLHEDLLRSREVSKSKLRELGDDKEKVRDWYQTKMAKTIGKFKQWLSEATEGRSGDEQSGGGVITKRTEKDTRDEITTRRTTESSTPYRGNRATNSERVISSPTEAGRKPPKHQYTRAEFDEMLNFIQTTPPTERILTEEMARTAVDVLGSNCGFGRQGVSEDLLEKVDRLTIPEWTSEPSEEWKERTKQRYKETLDDFEREVGSKTVSSAG
ncbi:hypothetical protein IAR55_001475 [Kwoniella newhampshirensis]|uniref:Uncharacterized protein n=1 Tax=Kwoniella newhampshirensis TaxID=1651941 RepID=A0AAW0Z2A4_9TREE